MKRRHFLWGAAGTAAISTAAWAGVRHWPERGWFNPCLGDLPQALADHPVVRLAWEGVDAGQFWDSHVHLVGVGDGGSGIWVNPNMDSPLHLLPYVQKKFYQNAACVEHADGRVDSAYRERLMGLLDDMRPNKGAGTENNRSRLLLFAFDWHYGENGIRREDLSTFHVPDYAARDAARSHPQHFVWAASIHPYRKDAIKALETALHDGAVAIKWLPAAMGMDPASPRCDAYFEMLAHYNVPLIVHAGEEQAVQGEGFQHLGNPLRLRRALAAGVRVVVAHCATHGSDIDFEHPDQPRVESFTLFERLMANAQYHGRLFGEISGITQINRARFLPRILDHSEWRERLLHGSDYPLVGLMPLFSLKHIVAQGLLDEAVVPAIQALRDYNPLLFDFVLKRHLRLVTPQGVKQLPASVFATRAFFDRSARTRLPAR